jgi:putative flippase GtrA
MLAKINNMMRYLFSGSIGFVLNIGFFWVLINFTNIWYVFAALISFFFSGLVTYNLHKYITYSNTEKTTIRSLSYFYTINSINIFVNILLIFIFVEYAHSDKNIALTLSSLLIAIYNYVIYKKYIYQK